jgi:metal-sulfur cluster biosynthetic enzyme
MVTQEQVVEALRGVSDPEIGFNIIDLGLVYDVAIREEQVWIAMTLTSPVCPAGDVILQDAKQALESLPGVNEGVVELVWRPRWDPRYMASDEVRMQLGL